MISYLAPKMITDFNTSLELSKYFDVILTNPKESFYLKKDIIEEERICCGYNLQYDSEVKQYNYIKCTNTTTSYVCQEHSCISIKYNCPTSDYFHSNTKYIDDKIRSFTYNNKHLKQFKDCKFIYYPNKQVFIVKYYSINNKLIFKGLLYDDLQFTKIIKFIESFHLITLNLIPKLELFYLTSKEILKLNILKNTPICVDVITTIVEKTFFQSDIFFIYNKIDLMNGIKYSLRGKYYFNLCKNIIKYYKVIFDNKKFKKTFKDLYIANSQAIEKHNLQFDKESKNIIEWFLTNQYGNVDEDSILTNQYGNVDSIL